MEGLFTAALGLQVPWEVKSVALDTGKRRIDFEVGCEAKRLNCPACGAADQGVHDRIRRDWRHLDFFQFEAWLHETGIFEPGRESLLGRGVPEPFRKAIERIEP